MILIPCPWCGPRDAAEYAYLGEVTARPDPATVTPAEWREYLYLRSNRAGWITERWYHRMGCRRYLVVRRDTVTNEVEP
jgi:heterotetrameric sarcosine oxidase delta subunit